MEWEKLGLSLRITERHLAAWHRVLRDAPLRLMQAPPEERDQKLDRLHNAIGAMMADLQHEQMRLHRIRSRKLARVFRLRHRPTVR